jgi:hypothetical protein
MNAPLADLQSGDVCAPAPALRCPSWSVKERRKLWKDTFTSGHHAGHKNCATPSHARFRERQRQRFHCDCAQGAQFYLTPEDVGKNRAEACKDKLQELNISVAVEASTADLSDAFLSGFQVGVELEEVVLKASWLWLVFVKLRMPMCPFPSRFQWQ